MIDWNESFSFNICPVKHTTATDDWQMLRRDIKSQLSQTTYSLSKMISLLEFGHVYYAQIRTDMMASTFSSKLSFSVTIVIVSSFGVIIVLSVVFI